MRHLLLLTAVLWVTRAVPLRSGELNPPIRGMSYTVTRRADLAPDDDPRVLVDMRDDPKPSASGPDEAVDRARQEEAAKFPLQGEEEHRGDDEGMVQATLIHDDAEQVEHRHAEDAPAAPATPPALDEHDEKSAPADEHHEQGQQGEAGGHDADKSHIPPAAEDAEEPARAEGRPGHPLKQTKEEERRQVGEGEQEMGQPEVELPEGYDQFARPPTANNAPLDVRIEVRVMRIYNPDWAQQTLQMDVDLISQWTDSRISVEGADGKSWYQLDPYETWHPGVLFFNSKRSAYMPNDDKVIIVLTNGLGLVRRVEWLPVELAQDFDFTDFPFDTQTIEAKVISYTYDDTEVRLWADPGPQPVRDNNSEMAKVFTAVNTTASNFTTESGRVKNVIVTTFQYSRQITSWLVEILIPTNLITGFSALALLVSMKEADRRMTISSIGLLSMLAFMTVINQNLPPVSYLSFMMAYTVFSFGLCFVITMIIVFEGYIDPGAVSLLYSRGKALKTTAYLTKIFSKAKEEDGHRDEDDDKDEEDSQNQPYLGTASLFSPRDLFYGKSTVRQFDPTSLGNVLMGIHKFDKFCAIFFPLGYVVVSVIWIGYEFGKSNASW